MAAYVIADVSVTDAKVFAEYRTLVPPTLEKYGGRFLVRGGTVETKEGGWTPARMVVIEFPSMDQARKWYHSVEYAPALAMRLRSASTSMIFVEGV